MLISMASTLTYSMPAAVDASAFSRRILLFFGSQIVLQAACMCARLFLCTCGRTLHHGADSITDHHDAARVEVRRQHVRAHLRGDRVQLPSGRKP